MSLANVPVRLVGTTPEEHLGNKARRMAALGCSQAHIEADTQALLARGFVDNDGWDRYVYTLRQERGYHGAPAQRAAGHSLV